MAELRTALVEVFDEEYVARRGTAEVHWFVRVNDAWLPAAKHPGAREQRLDPSPGVVYRTRVELDLPVGTRLMRVESKPGAAKKSTTVEHLLRAKTTTPRKVARKFYEVGRRGELSLVVGR